MTCYFVNSSSIPLGIIQGQELSADQISNCLFFSVPFRKLFVGALSWETTDSEFIIFFYLFIILKNLDQKFLVCFIFQKFAMMLLSLGHLQTTEWHCCMRLYSDTLSLNKKIQILKDCISEIIKFISLFRGAPRILQQIWRH